MGKMKIFDGKGEVCCSNDTLCNMSITPSLPPIKEIKASGSSVLVEILTVEEMMGSTLFIPNQTKSPFIQAIIKDMGPQVKAEEWGFNVGDRVVLGGDFYEVPKPKGVETKRLWGILGPHAIKCVLKQ